MENKIGYRINQEIKRPSKELLDRIREFSTCELCDGTIIYNAMDYHIKPMVTKQKICGPAITVKLPMGDSLMVTKAVDLAKSGDVIVVDGRGSKNNALWGDHRSLSCKVKGIEGVVIDGAFRDLEENEEICFPIYAKAVTCGSSTKNSNGEINVPISCGGVTVNPGDIIVGDVNGVCVIPVEYAEQIMENAQKKIDSMDIVKKEILEKGKVLPDNYAANLKKLGY
ncbi:RraA family protein [Tissierella sp.]|uniref:RraA family protein n=1 Tax=Tissierella sp. TaxID=41274 RepID=UPI0028B16384|nr:RraA family protein [Tissierella sp.]